ncbi:karyopherin [Podospora pseudoanserina]|uniref:Karyopherin n=1 Tax=Podospora pseudoanserina TaxID=2609844 RepID=A0ABR0ID61_9PEZI|nr:karyopherin [Podospora pseudoanserina]
MHLPTHLLLHSLSNLRHRSPAPTVSNRHPSQTFLKLCSSRLTRHESLPEDTEDPTYVLLLEDAVSPPSLGGDNNAEKFCLVVDFFSNL